MRSNTKKLAVLVIITVMALFILANMASAGSSGHRAIRGQYAFTGETGCLFSPSSFNKDTLQPIAGWGIIQTYSREGVIAFKDDGTGTAEIFSRVVALPYTMPSPPAPVPTPVPPNGGTQEITFDFTYTLTNDGKINIIVESGTFFSTQVTGPDKGRVFRIEGVLNLNDGTITPMTMDGAITPDGKMITLNSGAPDVFKITAIFWPPPPPPPPPQTNYSICRSSGILIWQHE